MCTNTGIESYRGLQLLYIPKHRNKEGVVDMWNAASVVRLCLLLKAIFFGKQKPSSVPKIAVKEMMFRQSWDSR